MPALSLRNKETAIFTGLIAEKGKIISLNKKKDSAVIVVAAKKVLDGAKIGDSIAVNGVCLTATKLGSDYFEADIMHETLNRTVFRKIGPGSVVNLEKSVTLTTFLGGHLVTGDIDTVGTISSIKQDGIAKIYKISLDTEYMKFLVEKGRVAIDGASLTVIDVNDSEGYFTVSLIPHTQAEITLGARVAGDQVNIETDLIGKYVYKFTKSDNASGEKKSGLTISKLAENGFL
ncbi:MAG: riboflavin synthase [Spirochaetales bacterium]|nr:riboflavin synthase [Spirochaetales bacterium]